MTRDVAASVRQRLLNRAKAEGRPFNQVLQHFAMERFLYRLGCSPYQSKLVLKGALMFTVWQSPFLRPTRDIDLLGQMDNTVENVVTATKVICQELAPEDGLRFDAEGVVGERIIETGQYEGVRVRFTAYLGRARILMQNGSPSFIATSLKTRPPLWGRPSRSSPPFFSRWSGRWLKGIPLTISGHRAVLGLELTGTITARQVALGR